eukprot:2579351-Rhodomonas_salina.4
MQKPAWVQAAKPHRFHSVPDRPNSALSPAPSPDLPPDPRESRPSVDSFRESTSFPALCTARLRSIEDICVLRVESAFPRESQRVLRPLSSGA